MTNNFTNRSKDREFQGAFLLNRTNETPTSISKRLQVSNNGLLQINDNALSVFATEQNTHVGVGCNAKNISETLLVNGNTKLKGDAVIGEDSSDLLVVNSETKFTGTVEGSITGNAATATKLNNSTDQNITNIKDLFNIDYSTHSASINFKNIENLNNKLNFLIDLLKLAMPNLT